MSIKLNSREFDREIKKIVERLDGAGNDIVDGCYRIVDDVTDKLMEESIRRCPVDEAMLEASHEKSVKKTPIVKDIVGRVFIPANSPAADYAVYMHEWTYNLGPRSAEKQAGSSVTVGRKFLERALDENARAFGLYIIKKLKELLR